MGFFKRSKEIFKASYDVVKKDKELLYFPILSALVSIAYFIGVFYPTIWVNLIAEGDSFAMEAFEWIITAVIYFGLAFISQFFNFCAIYTIKVRFTGGNSTMGEAIKYALSRAHLIFLWAIVSATVGLFFRLLDQAARNAGNGGRFVLSIIRFMAGLAWSVLSLFVIPAMVYYDLTPFEAMKKSSRAFTKTWGENLVRGIGMFIFALLFGLLGVYF